MTPARATPLPVRQHATRGLRALPLVAALATAACNPTPTATNPPPPSTIAITVGTSGSGPNKAIGMSLGDTIRIAYVINDFFGHPTGATPTFISRDTRVVAVSSRGLIRAQGEGTTTVVAYVLTTGSAFTSDSVRVTVRVVCTAVAKAGLVIGVQDSVTGSTGPFTTVSYVAKDTSAFKDSTLIAAVPSEVLGQPFLVGLAYEHPGKYDITVKATGYKPWVKTGVIVVKDECHVVPVSVTARLLK